MIEYLEGQIAVLGVDHAVIDIGGVGVQLFTSQSTLERLRNTSDSVKLYTSLAIRENDITIYGFADSEERELFRLLVSVKGVGPKIAIGILSAASADRLYEIIQSENAAGLSAVKGVGKKMAERMIVELRDKINKLSFQRSATIATDDVTERVYQTLTKPLGFSDREARTAIQEALKSTDSESLTYEELIKLALPLLSK